MTLFLSLEARELIFMKSLLCARYFIPTRAISLNEDLKVVSILEGTWQTEARALQLRSQSRLSKLKVGNTETGRKAAMVMASSDTGSQQEGREGDLIKGFKSSHSVLHVPGHNV